VRFLILGGPGRSGTSFVAERLGFHPRIAALRGVELKILCEKNGLQDLFHALVETYSPNRAAVALGQFGYIERALLRGQFGQTELTSLAPEDAWADCFRRFTAELCENGHPVAQGSDVFLSQAHRLLTDIAALAWGERAGAPAYFLEKTPHNLLAIRFLARLVPEAKYLHVMRDPRSIAWSLTTMNWGPDRLESAASWVASYCRQWLVAEAEAADLELPLMRVHIEDIVTAPDHTRQALGAWLGLDPAPLDMKSEAPDMLTRWTGRASQDQRALLDQLLAGWIHHFGYDMDEVGHRPNAEPSAPEAAT